MTSPTATVFLDSSSGEPLLPEARQAWLDAVDAGWGDPTRLHGPGRRAARALEHARAVVAASVEARPDEVVFTTSGAHSSTAAVQGLALGRRRTGDVVLTSTVDHSAVLTAADAAGRRHPVPVDHLGRLDLGQWTQALTPGESSSPVALACLQVANHEVGTLQPYPRAAELCAAAGVPLVLDASSALGRVDLSGSSAGRR